MSSQHALDRRFLDTSGQREMEPEWPPSKRGWLQLQQSFHIRYVMEMFHEYRSYFCLCCSLRQKFVPKGGAAENQEEEEEHQKEGNSY